MLNGSIYKKGVIFLFSYLFLAWGIYRLFAFFPEWVDEFLFKPAIWLGGTYCVLKEFENLSLQSLFKDEKNVIKNILFGVGAGAILVTVVLFLPFLFSNTLMLKEEFLSPFAVLLHLLISTATAITEETVFRGYLLTRLQKCIPNQILAVTTNILLFVVIHIPSIIFVRSTSWGDAFSYIFVLTVSTIGYTLIFLKTKSLSASIGMHTAWNFLSFLFR